MFDFCLILHVSFRPHLEKVCVLGLNSILMLLFAFLPWIYFYVLWYLFAILQSIRIFSVSWAHWTTFWVCCLDVGFKRGELTKIDHIKQTLYYLILFNLIIKYADPLLDMIDPQRVFSTRLFREDCLSELNCHNVKNLSRLGRDMRKVIYIDDDRKSLYFINFFKKKSKIAFLLHPHNTVSVFATFSCF